jgi:hypothetical protein
LTCDRVRRRLSQVCLSTAATVLLAATVGATRASFSVNASSAANRFAAGTVTIGDNDVGAAALTLSAAQPGATDTGCLLVTYGGSLPSKVVLYATVTGGLAPYLTLTVTRGTESAPTFDTCGGFTADATNYVGAGAGVVYSGALSSYPTSYATGLADPPTGAVAWSQGTSHTYKLAVTLTNNAAAQGQSATATFHWEARNT